MNSFKKFLVGYPPFTAESPDQIFGNILAHEIDWEKADIRENVSSAAKDLIQKWLNHDPKKRPTVEGKDE
jgi:serine/threonine-protein kinase RIM15